MDFKDFEIVIIVFNGGFLRGIIVFIINLKVNNIIESEEGR